MKKINLIGVLVLLFLWIRTMELFFTHFPWFGLKNLNLVGNEDLSKDEVLKLTGLRLKRNIFRIDLKEIAKRIEKDQRVKSVEIHRYLPGEIQIRVEEKKPDLLLNSNLSPRLYGISAEGEIIPLKESKSYDLPLINGVKSKSFKPYTRIEDKEIEKALSFYNLVKEENPAFLEKISEINLKEKDNLVVILINTGAKIFFGAGDFQSKFKRFIWLNEAFALEGFTGLDLRFNDQAIFKGVKKPLKER